MKPKEIKITHHWRVAKMGKGSK